MHRDKKLGLGLGVLLLGIVGAFFFRNDLNRSNGLPQLANPEQLDSEIAERSTIPYLTGLDTDLPVKSANPKKADKPPIQRDLAGSKAQPWTAPEFLQPAPATPSPRAAAQAVSDSVALGPPDPISTQPAFDDPMPRSRPQQLQQALPVPRHNLAWDVVPEPRVAETTRPVDVAPRTVSQSRSAAPASGGVVHRVASGDTLSGLASRYLGSGNRFMEIYNANQDLLKSPNDLRIGMNLRIPDGQSGTISPQQIQREQRQSQEFLNPLPENLPFGSTSTIPTSPVSHGIPPFQPITPLPIGNGKTGIQPPAVPQPAELEEPQFRKFVPARRSPLIPRGANQSDAELKPADAPRTSDSENPFEPARSVSSSEPPARPADAEPAIPAPNPFEQVAEDVSLREKDTVRR